MPVLTHVEFRGRKKHQAQGDRGAHRPEGGQPRRRRPGPTSPSARSSGSTRRRATSWPRSSSSKGASRATPGRHRDLRGARSSRSASIDFVGNVFATDAMLRTKIGSKTRSSASSAASTTATTSRRTPASSSEYYQGAGLLRGRGHARHPHRVEPGRRPPHLRHHRGDAVQGPQHRRSRGTRRSTTDKLREGLVHALGQADPRDRQGGRPQEPDRQVQRRSAASTPRSSPSRGTPTSPASSTSSTRSRRASPYLLGELEHPGQRADQGQGHPPRGGDGRPPARRAARPEPARDLQEAARRALGYFVTSPEQGKPIDIKIVNRRPHDKPYGDDPARRPRAASTLTRMQGPDPEPGRRRRRSRCPASARSPRRAAAAGAGRPGAGRAARRACPRSARSATRSDPPPDTPPIPVPIPAAPAGRRPSAAAAAAAPADARRRRGRAAGHVPQHPRPEHQRRRPRPPGPVPQPVVRRHRHLGRGGPHRPVHARRRRQQLPGAQRQPDDLREELRHLQRPPLVRTTSPAARPSAAAARSSSSQLMAGHPDQPVPGQPPRARTSSTCRSAAAASGYLFQRIYPDWTEGRGGGRFSLGRQFGTQTYADVAFRIEDVDFYGYRTPAPADYLAASRPHAPWPRSGPSLRFDNRNAPFMPNKGQYLEFSFEQGWGTFTYPKVEVEGRTYFTARQPPRRLGQADPDPPRPLRRHRPRHAGLRAVLRRQLRQPPRLPVPRRRPARPRRQNVGGIMMAARLGRVPVPAGPPTTRSTRSSSATSAR